MTSRCHGHQSGTRLSVRASEERGVVRAIVLTPLITPRSGIPPASSILASLGCKVLHRNSHACAFRTRPTNQAPQSLHVRPGATGISLIACMWSARRLREPIPIALKRRKWTYRPSEARTELAGGIPLCGVVRGVRPLARTTPGSQLAPTLRRGPLCWLWHREVMRYLSAFLLVTFLWQDKEK